MSSFPAPEGAAERRDPRALEQRPERTCPRIPVVASFLGKVPCPFRRIFPLNLRAHCRRLHRAGRVHGDRAFLARLVTVLEQRSRVFTDLHPTDLPVCEVLLRLNACRTRMIRQPETWEPAPDLAPADALPSLVSHLLDRWPVPAAFAGAWLVPGPLEHLSRDWYCHLAAGGSLSTLPGLPPLRRTVYPWLARCQQGRPVMENVRLAQLQSMHCGPEYAAAVAASSMATDFSNDGIWLPLLEKYKAADGAGLDDFPLLADALQAEVREKGTRRGMALLRTPLADLRKWALRWWADARLLAGMPATADIRALTVRKRIRQDLYCRWEPFDGMQPWRSDDPRWASRACRWIISPLCSLAELREEGRSMRHCVAGYASACLTGRSAIFHVHGHRPDGTGLPDESCTVEVRCATRRIIQIRARWNARASPGALMAVRSWAVAHRIRPGTHC